MFSCKGALETLNLLLTFLQGISFLHNTPLVCHGSLKSTNCLIDSRWVVKIADFGGFAIRHGDLVDLPEDEHYRGQWAYTQSPSFAARTNDQSSCFTTMLMSLIHSDKWGFMKSLSSRAFHLISFKPLGLKPWNIFFILNLSFRAIFCKVVCC